MVPGQYARRENRHRPEAASYSGRVVGTAHDQRANPLGVTIYDAVWSLSVLESPVHTKACRWQLLAPALAERRMG